ncbi:MAG: hypothetical protein ACTSXG_00620 [Alphaproteobacteria bacterium]
MNKFLMFLTVMIFNLATFGVDAESGELTCKVESYLRARTEAQNVLIKQETEHPINGLKFIYEKSKKQGDFFEENVFANRTLEKLDILQKHDCGEKGYLARAAKNYFLFKHICKYHISELSKCLQNSDFDPEIKTWADFIKATYALTVKKFIGDGNTKKDLEDALEEYELYIQQDVRKKLFSKK